MAESVPSASHAELLLGVSGSHVSEGDDCSSVASGGRDYTRRLPLNERIDEWALRLAVAKYGESAWPQVAREPGVAFSDHSAQHPHIRKSSQLSACWEQVKQTWQVRLLLRDPPRAASAPDLNDEVGIEVD